MSQGAVQFENMANDSIDPAANRVFGEIRIKNSKENIMTKPNQVSYLNMDYKIL